MSDAPEPREGTEVVPAEPPPAKGSKGAEELPPRTCGGTIAAVLGAGFGLLYVLNPTFGVFELLPDNLPGVGNLDEAGAAALLIFGLRYLLRRGPRAS